ncbi:MAG: DNA helicase RecQ [Bacillota bacterium]
MVLSKQDILKKFYGFNDFRYTQEAIIDSILATKDTLAIMPTGAGKSLCFQISAQLLPGVTLVISPLISLMKDQVDDLLQRGISAAFINSSLSYEDLCLTLNKAEKGSYKIIYIAPERLASARFMQMLARLSVSQVAVDEAHCISQWGHDFRPSYQNITEALRMLPNRPVISAYTATATQAVRQDIVRLLKLDAPRIFVSGLDRPNLTFSMRRFAVAKSKREAILAYLKNHYQKSGIIYATTRKEVEEVAEFLQRHGHAVGKYHAGLADVERTATQEAFINDQLDIIVATNAFGMGIDKPDIRFVLHNSMPKNLEAYYQEAGRAGRDGEPADCMLFFCSGDQAMLRFFIENGEAAEERKLDEYRSLAEMINYCSTTSCLRKTVLDYLGDDHTQTSCNNCSNCTDVFVKTDDSDSGRLVVGAVLEIEQSLGYNFGKKMIADVLYGADTETIRERRLNKLNGYGSLRGKGQAAIKNLIEQLIADRSLAVTDGQFPTVFVAANGRALLEGERMFMLREQIGKPVERSSSPLTRLPEYSNALFEQLRAVRSQLAARDNVRPYMVFGDKTLAEFCRQLPTDQIALTGIYGVGEAKSVKYGCYFVDIIKKHCEVNNIPLAKPVAVLPKIKTSTSADSVSDQQLFEKLRALRLKIAKSEGVPAFRVFTDKTLTDMTYKRPTTREAMLVVTGVGAAKYASYGERFVAVIIGR